MRQKLGRREASLASVFFTVDFVERFCNLLSF